MSGRRSVSGARLALVLMAGASLTACATARYPIETAAKPPAGAGRYKVGSPYQVRGMWYVPAEQPNYDERGVASWYGDAFNMKPTANGETFDMTMVSAAHTTLPMPSMVEVTNLDNGRVLNVRVNDRGPFVGDRIIDLSREAARQLGFDRQGLANVRVRYVGPAPLLPPEAGQRYASNEPRKRGGFPSPKLPSPKFPVNVAAPVIGAPSVGGPSVTAPEPAYDPPPYSPPSPQTVTQVTAPQTPPATPRPPRLQRPDITNRPLPPPTPPPSTPTVTQTPAPPPPAYDSAPQTQVATNTPRRPFRWPSSNPGSGNPSVPTTPPAATPPVAPPAPPPEVAAVAPPQPVDAQPLPAPPAPSNPPSVANPPGQTPQVEAPTVDGPTVDGPTINGPTINLPSIGAPAVSAPGVVASGAAFGGREALRMASMASKAIGSGGGAAPSGVQPTAAVISPYRVQVGAFSDYLNARRAVEILAPEGKAVIEPLERDGLAPLYRVLFPGVEDEAATFALRDRLATFGFADARVVRAAAAAAGL